MTEVRRRLRWAAIGLSSLLLLLLPLGLAYHVRFNERGLPDIEPLIRFDVSTTGEVHDRHGTVLIQLAREYRQIVSYGEVPIILRQAILAAEDKDFFSHSGVDYRVMPRVAWKAAALSVATWWGGDDAIRLRLPQGGSTITQQLVRGYLLGDRTSREDSGLLFHDGPGSRLLAAALGVPATNKLLRKLEEMRLAHWFEREMTRRYGSREEAKREIFSRYASLIYLGNGRYGFAAASEFYFQEPLSSYTPRDAGRAALLAGIGKSPRIYAPVAGASEPLRRRNEILTLMARNGYISDDIAMRSRSEPVLVAVPDPIKTRAPSAIAGVLDEMERHGGARFGVEDLYLGRVSVRATVDGRVQAVVNEALESGLAAYEDRHPGARGWIQGSVVVLRNGDAAILAQAGGRRTYQDRRYAYYDYDRVTESMRQPGSAWKPIVFLAAFRGGLGLDSTVLDLPIELPTAPGAEGKWIVNYDGRFKGPLPARQALAESRNTVAVWIIQDVGVGEVIRVARELGIASPLHRYPSTALGASEVRLLELAGAYRAMASGVLATPHVLDRVTAASGEVLYRAAGPTGRLDIRGLRQIQEGLRGVVRIPGGTAHALDRSDFSIPVMGKTGTTNDFRDALFVGSTYGPEGITVAVRIGYDDNRTMGVQETGGRIALPVFREIMLGVYRDGLVGPVPQFPHEIEEGIDAYLAALVEAAARRPPPPIRDFERAPPRPRPWPAGSTPIVRLRVPSPGDQ